MIIICASLSFFVYIFSPCFHLSTYFRFFPSLSLLNTISLSFSFDRWIDGCLCPLLFLSISDFLTVMELLYSENEFRKNNHHDNSRDNTQHPTVFSA